MKNKLAMLMLLNLASIGIAEANDKTKNTKFEYIAPYLGSIRDIYPSATIQTYRTDYFSYAETVSGDGFSKGLEYLYNQQKDKLKNMCNQHKGKFNKVYYGFDNFSVSERQLTDITINYSGGTKYSTGQKVHFLFNMYCATIE
ncbi:hypothetical protein [Shewanella sp. 10N.286.48.A6]|uniref:hypothetical protein n=1 Tax=Shewanella sp. 10N.286.48.A6 TaxID=1880833 RepID=UPI000C8662CB|nr:hypothetical protein [Shewanella sp. 10N.286.48.A6]PMH96970.1 hypothetical protein BCU55_02560 [Shewanella sp. 10N.286.48.A6]